MIAYRGVEWRCVRDSPAAKVGPEVWSEGSRIVETFN